MFDTSKAIFHSTKPALTEYAFNKYENSVDYTAIKHFKKEYHDHLGIIDTLGYRQERTVNSFYYSSEGGSIFCVYSCGLWFVFTNFDGKEMYVFKNNPFPYQNS